METEVRYKTKEPTFLTSPFSPSVSTELWIEAMLEAQESAILAVEGMGKSWRKVELFWVTFTFEFRQELERMLKEHAKLETG